MYIVARATADRTQIAGAAGGALDVEISGPAGGEALVFHTATPIWQGEEDRIGAQLLEGEAHLSLGAGAYDRLLGDLPDR